MAAETPSENLGDRLLADYAEHLKMMDFATALEKESNRLKIMTWGPMPDTTPVPVPWGIAPAELREEAEAVRGQVSLSDRSLGVKAKALSGLARVILTNPQWQLPNWEHATTPNGSPIVGAKAARVYVSDASGQGRISRLGRGDRDTSETVNGLEGFIRESKLGGFDEDAGYLRVAAKGLLGRRQYGVTGLIDRATYQPLVRIRFLD